MLWGVYLEKLTRDTFWLLLYKLFLEKFTNYIQLEH